LLEFGEVQRGLLGVQIVDVSADLAENRNLDVVQGVYITRVNTGSAADDSGMESGDVIVAINDHPVGSVSELQEWVARNRPGEMITVTFRRDGEEKSVQTVLKNFEGTSEVRKREIEFEMEGAIFEDLSYRELTKLNIDGGVSIASLENGKWKKSGIKEGFIITHIDKVPVDNVEDLNRIVSSKHGGMLVEGLYTDHPDDKEVYGVDW